MPETALARALEDAPPASALEAAPAADDGEKPAPDPLGQLPLRYRADGLQGLAQQVIGLAITVPVSCGQRSGPAALRLRERGAAELSKVNII